MSEQQQYNNTNKGALFPSKNKTTDNYPDHRGSLNVNGVEYWVSGWNKDTAKGPMISLSVQPKNLNQSQQDGHFDEEADRQ